MVKGANSHRIGVEVISLEDDCGSGACPCSRVRLRLSRSRRVLLFWWPLGDRVDEGLVVCGCWAFGYEAGLAVGLFGELWGASIGHPDLDWAEALLA